MELLDELELASGEDAPMSMAAHPSRSEIVGGINSSEDALKSAPNVLYARFKQFGQVRPMPSLRVSYPCHLTHARLHSSACSRGAPSSAS